MSTEESDGVRAARARMQANRDNASGTLDLAPESIRDKIIASFSLILWIALVLGLASAAWQLVTLRWITAVTTVISTIVTVGVGFVVLDIRERLIGR